MIFACWYEIEKPSFAPLLAQSGAPAMSPKGFGQSKADGLPQATLQFGRTWSLASPSIVNPIVRSALPSPASSSTAANTSAASEAAPSEASSILSSAEAYVRRQQMPFKGPSEVRVSLSLRFVKGGSGLVASLSVKVTSESK